MTIDQEIADKAKEGLKPFIVEFIPQPTTALVWAEDEDDAQDKAWQGEAEYEFMYCPPQPDIEITLADAKAIAELRRH